MTISPVTTKGTGSSTAEHSAAERRAAARALLAHPILSVAQHPEEMALVRRHAAALKDMFGSTLSYPLIVESSFARLIKAPLDTHTPARAARRSTGSEFSPRAYMHVTLVCAGLLAPSVGEQVLLSHLVEQERADAATAGLTVEDTLAERRALVAAIDLLLSWGVLTETDGTVAGWGERQEEALLSVNRAMLAHFLARPLHAHTSPEALWEQVEDPAQRQPRRDLRRKLVENPLVRREDLTDAERDVLSRERTELTRVLEESFGLTLEVRAEGALAFDADEELTDVEFPGNGTIRQAALLLLDALIDTLRPVAGVEVLVHDRPVPGVLAPWVVVDDNLEDLAARNAKSWRSEVTQDLDRLRVDVVSLLESLSLATATPDGLAIHPACARYRAQPIRTPATTRAARRMEPPDVTSTAALFPSDTPEQP